MSPCACCGKLIGAYRERMHPQGYCDAVCFAAHHTLSALAFKIWRANCYKLDVGPIRTVSG
jgi:hypothetical protein